MKMHISPALSKVLAGVGWGGTLLAGLLDIYACQFITISIYARFVIGNTTYANPDEIATSNTIRILTVLIAALIYVVFLIATSEYHLKHLGEAASWRLLGKTIAVELLIIAAAYITGPVTW